VYVKNGEGKARESEERGGWGYLKPNVITVLNISDVQSSQATSTL